MLPNLLIIGAPKAGTTSLHQYLAQHRQTSMSEPKELRYFWRPDWLDRRGWYESHFDASKPIRGESSPSYSAWPHRPNVPERVSALIPHVRVIYVVREPIARMSSHWCQRRADGFPESFESYIARLDEPDNPVVCPSRYGTQLGRWRDHFPPSQILVIDQHDLKTNRAQVLHSVLGWLGVDADVPLLLDTELNTREDKLARRRWAALMWDRLLWPVSRAAPEALKRPIRRRANSIVYRQVTERPRIDEALHDRLVEYFRPEVERLRELTGMAFPTWGI